MLQVGNGMTVSEDRAHFSMWAMLSAPLMAGNDITKMTGETRRILTNKEILAIDQDPLGIQAFPALSEGDLEVWAKPLSKDAWAICFLNRGNTPIDMNFNWKENTIDDAFSNRKLDTITATYKIRDLWAEKEIGTTNTPLSSRIPSRDVLVVKLEKVTH